jgi:predicted transcriptional regulator YdeE
MMIGYITEDGKMQMNNDISTLHIPAQDYRYIKVGSEPSDIQSAWQMINATPHSELPRDHEYDLEIYSEDGTEVTIAVSVKK